MASAKAIAMPHVTWMTNLTFLVGYGALDIMLDTVLKTICFFSMGLLWLYVVDAIFRLFSNRTGSYHVD